MFVPVAVFAFSSLDCILTQQRLAGLPLVGPHSDQRPRAAAGVSGVGQ